jgi:hypothetical protein
VGIPQRAPSVINHLGTLLPRRGERRRCSGTEEAWRGLCRRANFRENRKRGQREARKQSKADKEVQGERRKEK